MVMTMIMIMIVMMLMTVILWLYITDVRTTAISVYLCGVSRSVFHKVVISKTVAVKRRLQGCWRDDDRRSRKQSVRVVQSDNCYERPSQTGHDDPRLLVSEQVRYSTDITASSAGCRRTDAGRIRHHVDRDKGRQFWKRDGKGDQLSKQSRPQRKSFAANSDLSPTAR